MLGFEGLGKAVGRLRRSGLLDRWREGLLHVRR